MQQKYRMAKRKQNKYYRIIEDTIRQPNRQQHKADNDIKEIISAISHNRKYIYIDIAEERGFKMMEQCKESDSESELEQVGSNYIANLSNSSRDNRKSIGYLLKLRDINRQKQQAFRLIDDQLQKSQLKLRKKKFIFIDSALAAHNKKEQRLQIYHGMDASLLEKYKNTSELDSIDHEINEREMKLLNHYSTLPAHRTNLPSVHLQGEKNIKKRSLFPVLTQLVNTLNLQ